ncbi:MAG: hypothetical protein IPI81_08450 [Flavobacteriales bacterium]|nr:hypothetical protein [Flavobacteriales bacterium]MCC6938895.1 hypothetical protein [Flavobacteriales bacterium]
MHVCVLLLIGVSLCGCKSFERLPHYQEYRDGLLPGDGSVRTDGYYYLVRPIEFKLQKDLGAKQETIVTFFFQDGSCHRSLWQADDSITRVVERIRLWFDSERGARQSRDGFGWALYRMLCDTIELEQYTPVNGTNQVHWSRMIVQNDSTIELLGAYHPKKGLLSDGVDRTPIHRLMVFRPSSWKPDSTDFFRLNESFIRAQSR